MRQTARVSPLTVPAAKDLSKPTGCSPPTAGAGARLREERVMATNSDRKVIVVADDEAVAETAAQRVLARIAEAKDRPAICLTGGSSPEGLYRLLAEEPWRSRVPWDRVHWFMGDDRFVPESDPLSNMGAARRAFLDRAGAPRGNVHAIPTDAIYPEGAANLYQDT